METSERKNHTIVLPFDQNKYSEIVKNAGLFRKELDIVIQTNPELFPYSIQAGYLMKDIRYSKKLDVRIRRIKIGSVS